jgi:tetratricopeptide (TPR) repeat protein
LRARALIKLGRKDDSSAALQAALLRDPENAYTHANRGWVEMERNNPQEAMLHFREALRLNPEMTWARQGIVEALKARNPVYRWLLQYFFWMSRLSGQARWMVIMGAYFGARFVGTLSESYPALSPILTPLSYLYLVFVYLSWTGTTLFNLLLRLDRFGRLVLSEAQVRIANVVGGLFLLALLAFGYGWLADNPLAIIAAIWAALMVIPLAATLNRAGRPRIILGIYTAGLGLIGLAGLAVAALNVGPLDPFASFFLTGLFIFTLLANVVR